MSLTLQKIQKAFASLGHTLKDLISGKKHLRMRILLCLMLVFALMEGCIAYLARPGKKLDEEVLAYKDTIQKYAGEYGILHDTDLLLAILQVESAGGTNDVMQSSESLGLDPGTLEAEESIEQACRYFSILESQGNDLHVDEDTIIQAYNYGPGFITWIADNGGSYSPELSREYAKEKSGGKTVAYVNPISIQQNGGWIYSYGNMFYVQLIHQYY